MSSSQRLTNVAILIHAVKQNSEIPDQLLKKLDGQTLLQRSLDLAMQLAPDTAITIITESSEVALVGKRSGLRVLLDPQLTSPKVAGNKAIGNFLHEVSAEHQSILVLNPSAPLLKPEDVLRAAEAFREDDAELLLPMRKQEQRQLQWQDSSLADLFRESSAAEVYVESRAFFFIDARKVEQPFAELRLLAYPLEHPLPEIRNYHDWWVSEKLLRRKRIVFVVAGHAAIGMGHVYRALTIAHDISEHEIIFLCTKDSELAVKNIASREYRTVLQEQESLAEDVLRLAPDIVVNDFLSTSRDYVNRIKEDGARVVNFEDSGPGALFADLVINALLPHVPHAPSHFCCGPEYFCLRDEFLHASKQEFRQTPEHIMISFGGTDPKNYTRYALEALHETCSAAGIRISIVAGPGYAYLKELQQQVETLNTSLITLVRGTNVISSVMEQADIAITSAGRTVYELFHMQVPAIVLAQHEREGTHAIAQHSPAVEYLGVVDTSNYDVLQQRFELLLTPKGRTEKKRELARYDFSQNKQRVVSRILQLLATPSSSLEMAGSGH